MNELGDDGEEVLLSLPDEQLPDAILCQDGPSQELACSSQGPTTEESDECVMLVEVELAQEGCASPFSSATPGIFIKEEPDWSEEEEEEEEWGECSPAQKPPKRSVSPAEAPDGPVASPTVTCHGPSERSGLSWVLDPNKLWICRVDGVWGQGHGEDDAQHKIMGNTPTVVSSQESLSGHVQHDMSVCAAEDNDGTEEGAKVESPRRTRPQPIYQTQFVAKLGHEVTGVMVDKMCDLLTTLNALEEQGVLTRTIELSSCENFFDFDEMLVHEVPAFNNAVSPRARQGRVPTFTCLALSDARERAGYPAQQFVLGLW
jgi:hypothetical protein